MQPRRPTTRSQTTAAAAARGLAQTGPVFRLPDELLVSIACFLEVDYLADCVDGLGDLERFASTCTRFRAATSGLRAMTLKVRIVPSAHANTSPFSTAIRKLAASTRTHADQVVIRRLMIQDDSGPGYTSDAPGQTVQSRLNRWYAALATTVRKLPRLELFRYSTDIGLATSASPYLAQALHRDVLAALAASTSLRSLFLAGLRLTSRDDLARDVTFVLPTFNPGLQDLHLVAVDDSMLPLVQSCPSTTSLRVWRDFCAESRTLPSWFGGWDTVRVVRWRGFAGGVSDVLRNSVGPCRAAAERLIDPVPLTCLTLEDAMTGEEALALLRPFASVTLTSLSIVFWKDRHFVPAIVDMLVELFPRLSHLGVILERDEVKWWPHPIKSWASAMRGFESLKTFTWNHSPYPGYALWSIRPHLRAEAMHVGRAVASLDRLRFAGPEQLDLVFVRVDGRVVGHWRRDSVGSAATDGEAQDEVEGNGPSDDVFESTFVHSHGATQGESTLAKLSQARLEHQRDGRADDLPGHPPNRPSSVLANSTNRGAPPTPLDDVWTSV